eukprot:TRINITY_DN46_c0_g1_i1.p1 TRINITY_DN46_c0_g1~~TRINITY_DN46_c0_g1_i1.p1  ORF type:complete len:167 (-),score=14.83 TRINITY_DN46_c0_g1_i1:117-617(-)
MEGDSTQKPSSPVMCANGCGFFGNPLTSNLCSKCHRDIKARQQQTPESIPEVIKPSEPKPIIVAPITTPAAPSPTPTPSTTSDSTLTQPSQDQPTETKRTQADTTRCWSCSKRVGLLGFKCRCDYVFCSTHRYSDKHECPFDYKAMQKANLEKANPVVKGDKLQRI